MCVRSKCKREEKSYFYSSGEYDICNEKNASRQNVLTGSQSIINFFRETRWEYRLALLNLSPSIFVVNQYRYVDAYQTKYFKKTIFIIIIAERNP